MKNTLLAVVCMLLINVVASGQTKTFKGAFFDIKYPDNFTAQTSLKTSSGAESAFFRSPDGEVEFYIFSPQWSGDASDISLKSNEKVTSKKSSKSGNKNITWWTISSSIPSYTRSYQETKDAASNTNWVVGIKYKSQAAYDRYKSFYLKFKSSLQQYAD